MINPQILLTPFVPPDFKPLLSCVTPNAFRVIEWKKIMAFAPTLARRIATREGVAELKTQMHPFVPKGMILHDGTKSTKPSPLNADHGEAILSLYFAQLKCEHGTFLDLRPSCFSVSPKDEIIWNPNGLWMCLEPEFRRGMLSVYEGYYLDQPELLRTGLKHVGFIKDGDSVEFISEVEKMILSHIGGDASNQRFKVAHFTQSFEKLFRFLIKEKITLPPDFLYLGIYLGGLYMHLEALGGAYDVRRAFLEASGRV